MSTTDPVLSPTKRAAERRKLWGTFGLNLLLSALAFTLALPFVWMVLTSLKHVEEVGLPSWLPGEEGLQWGNYAEVFERVPFARYYANSLFVACWVTFLQVFTSSLAAFAFARIKWPGRDAVFLLYLATMMLPGLVMMIPNYQIMISLGLVDTLAGLIIPASFTAFGTFLLRQFMLSIPPSLDEAAEIDGASRWQVYWEIIMPLARPGLVTLAIFTFMGNYNSFFWPLVMLKSQHKFTLPIGLLSFDTTAGQSTHLMMAAVTMAVVPMIVVFVVLQKQLVRGIQLGAVKG
ncbi:carbohydrate ABC transporter permease [Mucisphaera calidilacus]|uniref:L-arabinose transport system permease protein AraQ n=1 Tax=Mucisphaera calidilacus TaxID=2527982 RepID=A0A518BWR4_9BACT|nr:carbohydrate ABC transporter permease [Mucisphaera calidilacus]QDU71420.1 L-arabinose transport system permease protein AraQ [Mucisphaera calidilacus]